IFSEEGAMKRSTERILSTHVGSLARPEALIPILRSRSDAQSSESGSRSLTRLPSRAMVRPTGPTESPSGCGDDDDSDTETPAMVRGGGSGPVRSAHDSSLRRGGRSTQVGFSVKAGRGDALGAVRDLVPRVVRSRRVPRAHGVLGALRDPRCAGEADAGQPHDPEPRRKLDGERGPESLRVQAA